MSRKTRNVVGIAALATAILLTLGTAAVSAQTTPEKIELDPSMIVVEPGVGAADEAELVDEQDAFPNGTCDTSWENWGNSNYPQSVYLDLGEDYVVTSVHLFNHGGDGDFHVSSGIPGNWSIFVTDPLTGYTGWETHDGVQVTTRYIRCTKTTSGKMSELILFGYPAGGTPQTWTLSLLGGGAMGQVSATPDLAVYPDGTQVVIQAIPASGYVFEGWTESGTTSTGNPLTLLMDRDRTVAANFAPDQPSTYSLETSVLGSGSVSPAGGTFASGEVVEITATPGPGWLFSTWQGDAGGLANPLQLTMDGDKSVVAVFTEEPGGPSAKLTLTADMVVDEKTGSYADTAADNLVDEQQDAGDPRAGAGGAVSSEWMPSWHEEDHPWSCYIDLGQPVALTDVYLHDHEWKQGDFTVSAGEPGGWIPLFTDGLSRNGEWFGVEVDVVTRYVRFTRQTVGSFVDEMVLYGSAGLPTQYSLTTSTVGPGAVAPASGLFNEGAMVTLTASPDSGYRFVRWSGDLAGNASPFAFSITQDTHAVAEFELIPPPTGLLLNSDFENGAGGVPDAWNTSAWRLAEAIFKWTDGSGRNGSRAVAIQASTPNDARWVQQVDVEAGEYYSVTGWIRGENIVNDTGSIGAIITELVSDTRSDSRGDSFDWTETGVTFRADSGGQAEIQARLGYWGSTVTGEAWYDDLSMVRHQRHDGQNLYLALEETDLAALSQPNLDRWLVHLDDAYATYLDLVGSPPFGGDDIGIVSYHQWIGGWAVAGNPIRWLQEFVFSELARVNDNDDWSFGILHEISHDFDMPAWNFNAEFFANFKMFYAVEQLDARVFAGDQYWVGAPLADFYQQRYDEEKAEYWSSGDLVGYTGAMVHRFIEIRNTIGWEPFRQTFRQLAASGGPTALIDRFNLFVDTLSLTSGQDVRALIPADDLYEFEHFLTGEPPVQFDLTVAVSGNGAVTVYPDLPVYNENAVATLTAHPAPGSVFDGWSGAVTGAANPQSLTISADATVTASFSDGPGGESVKLVLNSSMVVDEKTGGYSDTPAGNLFDEQEAAGDPRDGPGGAVSTEWMPSWNEEDYPWSCYINLGAPVEITDVFIYDHPWKAGDFSVSVGSPGAWTVVFSDSLERNDQWFGREVNAVTRYLRFTRHSRTAFVDEVVVYGVTGASDTEPPAAITDLGVSSVTSGSASLTWTATGDDGWSGTSASFDLRYRSGSLDEGTWAVATQAVGEPAPGPAGTGHALTVAELAPDTTYAFALVARDEVGNQSPLSNIAFATTDPGPPTTARTFRQFLGGVYVITNHADKIDIFNKLRLYLHTPYIAEYAGGPRDLAFDPADAWWLGSGLDPHFQARADNGTEVMMVLETVPAYMGIGGHAVAAPPGSDTTDPASFADHAEMVFQVVARYGSTAVPFEQIFIRDGQVEKTGLGTVARLQPYNESWEYWEGVDRTFIRPDGTPEIRTTGDWAPEEEAAMMAAVYDRVKQADPNMIVVWPSGLKFDPDQLNRTKEWLDVINGGVLPADEMAFTMWWNDVYPNTTSYRETLDWSGGGGRHPELHGGVRLHLDGVVAQVDALWPGTDVVITEFGWDTEPSPQDAPIIGAASKREVQAQWLVRSAIAAFASAIEAFYIYQVGDGIDPGLFGRSGLVETDNSLPKVSWFYVASALHVLGDAVLDQVVLDQPVTIYRFTDTRDGSTIYAVWSPTAEGLVLNGYELMVGGNTVELIELVNGSAVGQTSPLPVVNGSVSIDVSERPVFVVVR